MAAALLAVTPHTPPVRGVVLAAAASYLRGRGIELKAERFDYNLLTLSVWLQGVSARSTAAADRPAFLRLQSATASLSIPALLRGLPVVENAEVHGLQIQIVRDAAGALNLPASSTPREESAPDPNAPLAFVLERARVVNGSLHFTDLGNRLEASLPAWTLDVRGDRLTRSHQLEFRAQSPGTAASEGRALPVDEIAVRLGLRPGAVEVEHLRLVAVNSLVSVSGTVVDFASPALDLEVRAGLDLAGLAPLAGLKDTAGRLEAKAAATGKLERLLVTGQVSGRGLGFKRVSGVSLDLDARYERALPRVSAESLVLAYAGGSVNARAEVGLREGRQSWLVATVAGLELERIARDLELPAAAASRLSGSADARWPDVRFQAAGGKARLNLTASRREPARNLLPVSGALAVTARDGTYELHLESLESAGVRLTGRIASEGLKTVAGALEVTAESLARVVSGAESFLGRTPGSLAGTALDGALRAEAQLAGSVEKPEISLALEAPALAIAGLRAVGLSARAGYTPGRATLETAALTWQGQTLTASGEVALGGESPETDLNARMAQASLPDLLAGLGLEAPVEGHFSLDAGVTGPVRDLKARLTASAGGLRAYGEALGEMDIDAGLAGRRLELARLRLERPDGGRLAASGTFDLDSRRYSVKAEGDLAITDLVLPEIPAVRARLNLEAGGEGTLDNPSLAAALKATDARIGGMELGALDLAARIADRQADMRLTAPRFSLEAGARLATEPPYPAELDLAASGTDLSLTGIQGLEGAVTLSVKGRGDLAAPAGAAATLEVSNLLVKARGVEVRNEGPLQATYLGHTLKVASARLVAGLSRLSLWGELPLEDSKATGPLFVAGSFDVGEMLALLPETGGVSGRGTLNLDAAVRGSVKRLDPAVRLRMEGGVLEHPQLAAPVTGAAVAARYEAGLLIADRVGATLGQGQLEATARAPVATLTQGLPLALPEGDQGPASFLVNLRNLDLKSFRAAPEQADAAASLIIQGETERPADLLALRARAVFQQLRVRTAGYQLEQSGESSLSVSEGTARVDHFHLTGPATSIRLAGSAPLAGDRPFDIRAAGNIDASLLTLFTGVLKAQGATTVEIAVAGQRTAPRFSGSFEMRKGQASLRTPRLEAQDLDVSLAISPESVEIRRFTGSLNGGSLNGLGVINYAGGRLRNVRVNLLADGAYLEFPPGLRSQLRANLTVRSKEESLVLGGGVQVLESSYLAPLEAGGDTLNYFRPGGGTLLLEERNPFLNRIRFDLGLDTQGPILVDNNLAKLTLNASLRLVGGVYRPGLTGRASLEEGGKLFFNERTYLVDRGVVTFNNQTRIEPELDILARTEVRPYEITLQLSGPPEKFSAAFTAEPQLSEPDIISVLLTGRTMDELEGAGLMAAREQAGSLLAGRAAGFLSRGAQQSLGLSQVRIDPSFINSEANPGARLTVGQDVTSRLQLIYSMNLVNGGDQIYIARYGVGRRFQTEGTRQSDNTYRFDFRHDLQFGGGAQPETAPARPAAGEKITGIEYAGNPLLPAETLNGSLDLRPGDAYDFFRLQRGIDRLVRLYESRGRLEANIRVDRRREGSSVALTIHIEAGPAVDFVFEGREVPGGVRNRVRAIWRDGLFDTQRLQDAVRAIRADLVRERHYLAAISHEISTPSEGSKRVLFRIRPGPRFGDVPLVFEGARGLPPGRLAEAVRRERLSDEAYLDPARVAGFLTRYYRQEGWLDAKVGDPRPELDAGSGTGRVVIPVREGERFKIAAIQFRGNQAVGEPELKAAVPVESGADFGPAALAASLGRIEELYWAKGYNDAVVNYTVTRADRQAAVEAHFQIDEGRQEIVQAVEIEGNRATSDNLVRIQLALRSGDVLDLQKANRSRRSLYETGAYSLVEIRPKPEEPAPVLLPAGKKPVTLQVRLREVRPFQFRYGAFYDTERGPGAIADFSNRNTLGAARHVGVRTRWDSDIRELRGYFSQPFLRRFPAQSNIIGYHRREIEKTFYTDRTGFSLQQEARFRNKFIVSYGYRLERTHVVDRDPDSPFQLLPYKIAPLAVTATRDTRDDPLDATRGSFLSQAFEVAPASLRSDIRFVRYFGQYFKFVPLSAPAEVPFGKGLRRSRWTYAGAVRVGLAKGLGGQELIFSERFRTGGGTTLRGFEQNTVGPVDFFGDPAGGNALLLLNSEARFPLVSILDGVGFLDMGNVYARAGDFSLSDTRKVGGVGLRIRTPYFLLRADYGLKLDRRPGEAPGRFFFSIGQAF